MNIRLPHKYKGAIIENSKDIYEIMKQILDRENQLERSIEHFWVVCLNKISKVINIEVFALGRKNIYNIDPKELFTVGIIKRASQIILVHNEINSSFTKVTPFYINLTDKLLQLSKVLNVSISDHIVIKPQNKFFSFKGEGLLDELLASKRFPVLYKKEDEIRKEAMKIGEQNVIYTIVKNTLALKYSYQAIRDITNLSIEEIKKIKDINKL